MWCYKKFVQKNVFFFLWQMHFSTFGWSTCLSQSKMTDYLSIILRLALKKKKHSQVLLVSRWEQMCDYQTFSWRPKKKKILKTFKVSQKKECCYTGIRQITKTESLLFCFVLILEPKKRLYMYESVNEGINTSKGKNYVRIEQFWYFVASLVLFRIHFRWRAKPGLHFILFIFKVSSHNDQGQHSCSEPLFKFRTCDKTWRVKSFHKKPSSVGIIWTWVQKKSLVWVESLTSVHLTRIGNGGFMLGCVSFMIFQ